MTPGNLFRTSFFLSLAEKEAVSEERLKQAYSEIDRLQAELQASRSEVVATSAQLTQAKLNEQHEQVGI